MPLNFVLTTRAQYNLVSILRFKMLPFYGEHDAALGFFVVIVQYLQGLSFIAAFYGFEQQGVFPVSRFHPLQRNSFRSVPQIHLFENVGDYILDKGITAQFGDFDMKNTVKIQSSPGVGPGRIGYGII